MRLSKSSGDSEDKASSQFALPFREIESPEFIKAIVDAEDHFLFGIQLDGSISGARVFLHQSELSCRKLLTSASRINRYS